MILIFFSYFCMVKRKKGIITLLVAAVATMLYIYLNAPIAVGEWTKQTLYLWTLNCCHIQSKDAMPRILLIDDDSGEGVFSIKRLCDELHMKATFAVIPSKMSQNTKDSLKSWQKQGYDIALHGYDHNNWRGRTYKNIVNDIIKCEKWLADSGFMPLKSKFVVAPRGSNTQDVRKAIKDKGYQMITGANIINPDTQVFMLGRIFITHDTDIKEMEDLLWKAKERKLYVIFGTHSSIQNEFSLEKTKAILQMAQNMGFEY